MDYSRSKNFGTAIYPVHAEQTSGLLRRSEPLLTAEKLKSRYLKGIPLVFPNGDAINDDDLKDKILVGMNETELLLNTTITREAFKDKLAFDWNLYKAFIHLRSEQGPISSLESLAICAANGQVIFQIPPDWIEAANFSKNLINVVPLLASFGTNTVQGSVVGDQASVGAAFLAVWSASGNAGQIPAYWQIHYTSGLSSENGEVPVVINDLIGVVTAMDILSLIAPSNMWTSQSLSQDGISQSSSGPGPSLYKIRLEELQNKRDELVRKLKAVFSRRFFIGNI